MDEYIGTMGFVTDRNGVDQVAVWEAASGRVWAPAYGGTAWVTLTSPVAETFEPLEGP